MFSFLNVQASDKSLTSSNFGVCGRDREQSLALHGQTWLCHISFDMVNISRGYHMKIRRAQPNPNYKNPPDRRHYG